MNLNINKNRKNFRLLVSIILMVFFFGLCTYLLLFSPVSPWPGAFRSPADSSTPNDLNLSDSTYGSDKKALEDSPARSNSPQTNSDQDSAPTGSVDVAIAYAAQDAASNSFEIRAFIPNVIEGNGECTATLIMGGAKISKTSKAFIDAATSQCNPIMISLSDLSPGQWGLIVEYKSPTYTGVSETIKVNI